MRWTMPPRAAGRGGGARGARGNVLHVTLDFDHRGAPCRACATLVLLPGDAGGAPVEMPMRWEDEDRLAAEYTLPAAAPGTRW